MLSKELCMVQISFKRTGMLIGMRWYRALILLLLRSGDYQRAPPLARHNVHLVSSTLEV